MRRTDAGAADSEPEEGEDSAEEEEDPDVEEAPEDEDLPEAEDVVSVPVELSGGLPGADTSGVVTEAPVGDAADDIVDTIIDVELVVSADPGCSSVAPASWVCAISAASATSAAEGSETTPCAAPTCMLRRLRAASSGPLAVTSANSPLTLAPLRKRKVSEAFGTNPP